MNLSRSHKIRIYPNKAQETLLKQSCGVARFVYNWGLNAWKTQYLLGLKPSAMDLKKQFNAIKAEEFPFVLNVSKCAAEQAFTNLGRAYKNFFREGRGYPHFKKKKATGSFYLANDQFKVEGHSLKMPKSKKKVRMAEALRFTGKIMSATISNVANQWYISISVLIKDYVYTSESQASVGVDLGLKHLAITSEGQFFENPRSYKTYANRLRRLNQSLSRKKIKSKNWIKAKIKLAKLHKKISDLRNDHIHKLTHFLTTNFKVICTEDLHIQGMVRNKRLSKALYDAGLGEISRQLTYKSELYDSQVVQVGRFFPSSKKCSACGHVKKELKLSERVYICDECSAKLDRDLNASINIWVEGLRLLDELKAKSAS